MVKISIQDIESETKVEVWCGHIDDLDDVVLRVAGLFKHAAPQLVTTRCADSFG